MHVLNNFFAYGLALSFGDMTEALNATGPASPWMIVSTLTQSLVYLGARDAGSRGRWASSRHGTAGRAECCLLRDAIRPGGPFWMPHLRACNVRGRFCKEPRGGQGGRSAVGLIPPWGMV